jgi:hypothetical protein
MAWYRGMTAIIHAHADATGLSPLQCASVYAAASINTPWSRNLAYASDVLAGYINGDRPTGGHLKHVVNIINRILDGETIDTVVADPKNLKIRNFTRNLAGDYNVATIDRWAYRIAVNYADCPNNGEPCAINSKTGKYSGKHSCGKVPKGAEYEAIAASYARVASYIGIDVASLQAITWCVVRGDGE